MTLQIPSLQRYWVRNRKRRAKRLLLWFYHRFSFILPCGLHRFPVASSPSLPMSLLCHFLLSVYLFPWDMAVLFLCRSSGHKSKESPRQPSVYKAFCHVYKDKPFLSPTSQIPNSNIAFHLFTWRPACIATILVLPRLICVYMAHVSERVCVS